jgi:hypothetical protein
MYVTIYNLERHSSNNLHSALCIDLEMAEFYNEKSLIFSEHFDSKYIIWKKILTVVWFSFSTA